MVQVMCVTQSGQVPPRQAARLGARLSSFTERAFGEPADINWVDIAEGDGFTAAQPSTSMVVSARSNRALERDERTRLLHELCDTCVAETDKSADELVLVVLDPVS